VTLSPVRFASTLTLILVTLACSSASPQSNNGTGGSTSCPAGSETCPCKSDKTCDEGLDCRSNLCVATASSGGANSSSGGASSSIGGKGGSNSSGGSQSGGATPASGGVESSGGSATETGGEPASGGDGAGGSAECTADTQTDPENCGACGKVCRYELWDRCNDACCQNGACVDSFGECIREQDGFATCAEYCGSIGEECVQQGCGTNTYRAWSGSDTCGNFSASVGDYNDPCDAPIDFGPDTIRCCCTDRAP
jgi:hypothetical protein